MIYHYLRRLSFVPLLLIQVMGFGGCGYGFQNSRNPLFLKEGIRKVYVSPVVNNSYKAGIENVIYNSLIRAMAASGRVVLVQNSEDADAVLQGTVVTAVYGRSAATSTVAGLNPAGIGLNLPTRDYVISTEYTATLSCSFVLARKHPSPSKKTQIWASSFARSKPFPAANQLDVPGTTSPLINESEFDRTLSDISKSMMDDVHESMLAMF